MRNSRAISTQESGNLPYHMKTTCSYLQKSIKKEQFHPQNAGNGIRGTLNLKIFPMKTDPPGQTYVAYEFFYK